MGLERVSFQESHQRNILKGSEKVQSKKNRSSIQEKSSTGHFYSPSYEIYMQGGEGLSFEEPQPYRYFKSCAKIVMDHNKVQHWRLWTVTFVSKLTLSFSFPFFKGNSYLWKVHFQWIFLLLLTSSMFLFLFQSYPYFLRLKRWSHIFCEKV